MWGRVSYSRHYQRPSATPPHPHLRDPISPPIVTTAPNRSSPAPPSFPPVPSFPRKRESNPPSPPTKAGAGPESAVPRPSDSPAKRKGGSQTRTTTSAHPSSRIASNRHSSGSGNPVPIRHSRPLIVIPAKAGIQTPVTPTKAGAGPESTAPSLRASPSPKLLTLAPLQAS